MTKVAINGISRDYAAPLARSPMPGNGQDGADAGLDRQVMMSRG